MMRAHRELGCGFLEKVYQEALEREFTTEGISFQREANLKFFYRGVPLQQEYVADFVCNGKIIVELKAISKISNVEKAQVINYLKVTGYELGILANLKPNAFATSKQPHQVNVKPSIRVIRNNKECGCQLV